MPKPLNCCFPGTPCTEHRVLIDGLSDKHNALAAVVAANAESARAKIEQVEEATRSRDADINELKTNVVLEKERREAADSSLAADIERERANREQAIELVRIDCATKQSLSEAKSELTADIATERNARENTDAAVLAERNARMAADTALSQSIASLASKEATDLEAANGRIDAANAAVAAERRDRADAVKAAKDALSERLDGVEEDFNTRINRLTASTTEANSAEALARQTADGRLSAQISTALQSASDAQSAVTRLEETVAENKTLAGEWDAQTLADAKEYADGVKTQLRQEIDTRVQAVFVYRGQRESNRASDLPLEGNKVGDVYNVKKYYFDDGTTFVEGANVVWNGTAWDKMSEDLDLSVFADKEATAAALAAHGQRLDDAEATVSELQTSLAEAQDGISSMRGELGEKPEAETTVWAQIGSLNASAERAESKIETLEDFRSAAGSRLDSAEARLTATEQIAASAQSGVGMLEQRINDDIAPVLQSHEAAKTALEGRATALEGRATALEAADVAFRKELGGCPDGEDADGCLWNGKTVWGSIEQNYNAARAANNGVAALGGALNTLDTRTTALSTKATALESQLGVLRDTTIPAAVQSAKDYADAADTTLATTFDGKVAEEATLREQNDAALGQRIDNLAQTIANDYALVQVDDSTLALVNRAHNRFTVVEGGTVTFTMPPTAGDNRSRDFTLRLVVAGGVTASLAFAGFGDEGTPTLEKKKGETGVLDLSEGVNIITFTETAKNVYFVARVEAETI